ncbi:MAG: YihY/virulence factor BrkB family protein [Deltaproteobacteria bacterium]|nr:YihY/virulence factor BrkB family protein [Deltaproteobacteria bacterium]
MEKTLNIRNIIDFITHGIWRIRLGTLPRNKSFFLKQLRIIILAFRGFAEDKCYLRASALTFYTLLSVVPAAALAFGVAKGFGLQKLLEKQLFERLQGQEEVLTRIITFANSMLEETRGGLIAGIGVVLLFWLIIKLLGNIEASFNDIWGIRQARTYGRKLSDYLSVMLTCPLLLILSGSITVFITTRIEQITQRIDMLGAISPLISLLLKSLPLCVIWLLFTFVYIFMPNTKVRFRAGLLGGIIAGLVYQALQWGYITFQIGVSKYGAIYGSFAALPLFLIWLQISWLIVLFGAEISFAFQNVDTYEFEPDCLRVKPSFKRLLALRIAHSCIKSFSNGDKPQSAEQISHDLEIPIRLVNQILFELVQCRILTEAKETSESEALFLPAMNIDRLSINYVIQALEGLGTEGIPVAQSRELSKLSGCLTEFIETIGKSQANLLLKDI